MWAHHCPSVWWEEVVLHKSFSDEQWIETFRVIRPTFDLLVELVRVDVVLSVRCRSKWHTWPQRPPPPLKTQQSRTKSRAGKGGYSGPMAGHAVSRRAYSSQTDSFSWDSPGSGKAAGAGGPLTSPFFVAGSSPWWGCGHSTSCSESAAVGAGLLTSPMISDSETAALGAGLRTSPTISGSETAAVGAGLWTSPTISGSKTAAVGAGLRTSPPFFVASSSPFWGSGHRTPCGGGTGSRGSSCSSAPGGGGTSRYSPSAGGGGRGQQSSEAVPAPLLLVKEAVEVAEAEAAPAPLLRAVAEAEAAPAALLLVEEAVEVAEIEAMGLMLATQREAVAVLAPSAVAAGLVRTVLPSAA
ncbi:UNVERIFIED_CONTAM: hypothetical protein FKN15_035799 [Acipenser sinensis]